MTWLSKLKDKILNRRRRKEYAVGDIFVYNKRYLRVIEDRHSDCSGCTFDDEIYGCMKPVVLILPCTAEYRKDKKNVAFKALDAIDHILYERRMGIRK